MKKRQNASAKPYHRCLSCPRFRSECGGIPTRGLDLKEWSEYIRDVMDHFELTAQEVAKDADVSLRKVESIHAINIKEDIMRATARRIEQVVLGSVTRFICDMDFDTGTDTAKIASIQAEIAALREDVAYWRKENDRKAKIIDKYLDS